MALVAFADPFKCGFCLHYATPFSSDLQALLLFDGNFPAGKSLGPVSSHPMPNVAYLGMLQV
jgi:hypothetical protein